MSSKMTTKRLSVVTASPASTMKKVCLPFKQAEKYSPSSGIISEVLPFLVIGDDRISDTELMRQDVTAIIDCRSTSEQELRGLVGQNQVFNRLNLPLRDIKTEDASRFFYSAVQFIENERLNKGKVLVHCTRGISRSSALVCAYLIWANNLDCREALSCLKSRHPVADPNPSFCIQLADFAQYRFRETIAFQITLDGGALVGPLTREAVEMILHSNDGTLLVTSKQDNKQYIWSADDNFQALQAAERMAQTLAFLDLAAESIENVSFYGKSNSDTWITKELAFQQAISLL
jgi:predicted protein tyrosine phosphatase